MKLYLKLGPVQLRKIEHLYLIQPDLVALGRTIWIREMEVQVGLWVEPFC